MNRSSVVKGQFGIYELVVMSFYQTLSGYLLNSKGIPGINAILVGFFFTVRAITLNCLYKT